MKDMEEINWKEARNQKRVEPGKVGINESGITVPDWVEGFEETEKVKVEYSEKHGKIRLTADSYGEFVLQSESGRIGCKEALEKFDINHSKTKHYPAEQIEPGVLIIDLKG